MVYNTPVSKRGVKIMTHLLDVCEIFLLFFYEDTL